MKKSVPAIEVVPHKGVMSLLGRVLSHDARSTQCDVAIGDDTLFLKKDRVAAWIGLEYMAQAVAAHAGMAARKLGRRPEIGFWLGTRKADFYTPAYRKGQRLLVSARHVWGEGDLFSFDCQIADAANGRRLAAAQINVFRPRLSEAFLKRNR